MRRQGAKEERPGWVKAPSLVEVEIRAVWQEDELPEEITQAPGHHPFTLSLEAQEWVDSMAEVVDGGNGVYGRPKPVIPVQRRQLATSPPPPVATRPPAVPPPSFPPANYRSPPPSKPRVLMPDIDEASPKPAPAPHVQMPEIETVAPPPKRKSYMPEIDETSPQPSSHVLMPEIDETPPPPGPRATMPEIDDSPTLHRRTLPRRVLMPEVGEEQPSRQPPSMPEIG
jgi:hypothetical protein